MRELIRRVHQELIDSREERRRLGLPPIFEVESMTIEVNFVATEAKDVRGGLDFRVITAGASRRYDEQQVHKITLSLVATGRHGDVEPGRFADLDEEGTRFMPSEEG